MGRVLFITYEYPPSGGGGVQRVAKFTRYLPEFGWDPVVVTATAAKGRPIDESLAAEVTHVPVVRVPGRHVGMAVSRNLAFARGVRDAVRRSPGGANAAATDGAKVAEGVKAPSVAEPASAAAGPQRPPGRTQQITQWIASPDFAGYWIRGAVKAAIRVGREMSVDAVVASSPPFSALVAGARTAEALGVPLVADFRDAWRDNPGAWYPTAWHRRRSLELEKQVLRVASAVSCVSLPIQDEVVEMGGRNTFVLPNGFDSADVALWDPRPGSAATIAFMGWLYPAQSDGRPLFRAMSRAAELSDAAAEIVFNVIGRAPSFMQDAAREAGVADRVHFLGYRPHAEAIELLSHADAGVVLIRDVPESKGTYTGKIFEYLGMGIPILLAGPQDGVAAELVREANAGWVVPHGDVEHLAKVLVEIAEQKRAGHRREGPDAYVVARFDRRSQAGKMARILDETVQR